MEESSEYGLLCISGRRNEIKLKIWSHIHVKLLLGCQIRDAVVELVRTWAPIGPRRSFMLITA
jgi:hypothetical protein